MSLKSQFDAVEALLCTLQASVSDPTASAKHALSLQRALATLRKRVVSLEAENKRLRVDAKSSEQQPSEKMWGCYRFAEDEHFYCPHCWENNEVKSVTKRLNTLLRACATCGATIKRTD